MMTTLGKAVNCKLYNFIEELIGRYTIDNERETIPIINEEFTAETEDGTKITGILNGYIEIEDWYYDDDLEQYEDHYSINIYDMYIRCEFQYTTDKGEHYSEIINNF